jgi:hypothetical protein
LYYFVERYHFPGIHPEFFRAIDFNQIETTASDGLVRMTAPPGHERGVVQRRYCDVMPSDFD